jgi:hypothetical protein
MRRSLLMFVVLMMAAGCQYEPLDNEANKPELGNSVLSRDIVVTGTSWVLYFETDNGQFGDFLCTTEQKVEGWASDELNDETCVGCEATYTLGFSTVDTDCDFGAGATADIAFTPLSFFDQANETSFWGWLTDNEAIEFVNATWSPRGPSGWEARLGVFEDDWASPPDQDGVSRSCEGAICAESRWWYPTADWYGKWWLDIDIDLDES